MTWIKIALDREKEKVETNQKELSTKIAVLKLLTESENVVEDIDDIVNEKYENFKVRELLNKEHKIKHLKADKSARKPSENKSSKKTRKFEKRSKYKRRMKKK